jgi:hypothetical protein
VADRPAPEEVLAAATDVVEESGRWYVHLNVILASGAVRRRVGEYHDQRRAEQAARIIERNARRYIPPAAAPGHNDVNMEGE